MGIQTSFSIKDLENLSQIKAHTIRIWEKRYNLFSPTRSDTNIRSYSNEDLQKLLNIALLINYGYKISIISKKTDEEIKTIIEEQLETDQEYNSYYNNFKIAMLNLDKHLFEDNYSALLKIDTFENIYVKIFYRLLTEIGLMWQTNSVNPAQEHFISTLIHQKLLIQIEAFNTEKFDTEKNFVFFLPENEVHQIGLLFIQYLVLQKGINTIFLGPSITMENLCFIEQKFKNIEYITNVSTKPKSISYFEDFEDIVLKSKSNKLHVFGYRANLFKDFCNSKKIFFYTNPYDFIKNL